MARVFQEAELRFYDKRLWGCKKHALEEREQCGRLGERVKKKGKRRM
jgi:hypothetical protein